MARTIAEKLGIQLPMWHNKAECRNYPSTWWIAEKAVNNHNAKNAKAVCNVCPVKAECLRWAQLIERDQATMPGIYGGLTQQERRSIRICGYENCDKPTQILNPKPRAQNNYCSEDCRTLQAKLVVHRSREKHVNKPSEYYMQGIVHG